jgi:RimJ/RimL family protein N-acetyltransferase
MTEVQVRALGAADLAAYRALRLHALTVDPLAFGASVEDERELDDAAVIERLTASTQRGLFGAFDGQTLVGTAGWYRSSGLKEHHKAAVVGVFVAGTHRGSGVARRLMQAVIDATRATPGLRQLNLISSSANAAAVKLYESFGFTVWGREPAALYVAGEYHEDTHMSLVLHPSEITR